MWPDARTPGARTTRHEPGTMAVSQTVSRGQRTVRFRRQLSVRGAQSNLSVTTNNKNRNSQTMWKNDHAIEAASILRTSGSRDKPAAASGIGKARTPLE